MEGIPHVPDDAAYLFMAKNFATGHVITTIPIPWQFVDYFPSILAASSEKWLFVYPFGHPLVLSIGFLLGFPNIIPPLIGCLSIFFLFLIAKNLYGRTTAFFLLPLPFLSPFFLQNASSFMSHNTSAFYLTLSLFFLTHGLLHKKPLYLISTGIFMGLLFNTRPLTAVPFLIIGFLIFFFQKKLPLKKGLYFFIGLIPLLLSYLAFNHMTAGSALQFQYYNQIGGFFQNNNLSPAEFVNTRFQNVNTLFQSFGPMLFNVFPLVAYLLLLAPFILKKSNFWDRFFLLAILALPLTYFFYNGTFIMYGPRFWYETIPFIFLLSARALALFYKYNAKLTIIIFIFFACISSFTWYGLIPSRDPDIFSPLALSRLKNFNFVNNNIVKTLNKYRITNGVIFVENCEYNWWCYGSVFAQNSPQLDTPIIFLKDLGDTNNLTLKKYYPSKPFFRINYYSLQIVRIDY